MCRLTNHARNEFTHIPRHIPVSVDAVSSRLMITKINIHEEAGGRTDLCQWCGVSTHVSCPARRHVDETLHRRCVLDGVQEVEQAVHLHEKGQPVHLILIVNAGRVKDSRVHHRLTALHSIADGSRDQEIALYALTAATRRCLDLPGRRVAAGCPRLFCLPRRGQVVGNHLVAGVQQSSNDRRSRPARGAGDEHSHRSVCLGFIAIYSENGTKSGSTLTPERQRQ